MASSQELSKENIYFLRSFLLLIEGGLYISKEILVRECQNPESDLDELLKRNESKLRHLFHGKQYRKLYPDFGKADINSWDLQLTIGVLVNVFRRSIESTENEKLRLLRDLRNDIYMHSTSASLDEEEFEDVKEKLVDIITTLASNFDKTVQERCSRYIEKFTIGNLDDVRPSLNTLNGFSLSCQKKFKVAVNTELQLVGPNEWVTLSEQTLNTIFNHASSMASGHPGFREIQENVKKMLDILEKHKDVVFKGSKVKCVILSFECKDYESFLRFLEDVESQEYHGTLRSLSDSLVRFFIPKCSISLSSRVTTESLQSALLAILKTISTDRETQGHYVEISSEDNGSENRTMSTLDTEEKFKSHIKSQKPFLLGFELTSGEGLLHLLHSFQERQFSDNLKNVASSLSSYHKGKGNLKASINVGDVMEAFEESVSRDIKTGTTIKNIDHPTSKESDIISAPVEEKSFLTDRIRLIKSVAYIRREMNLRSIEHLLRELPFTDTEYKYIVLYVSHEYRIDRFLAKLLTGCKELQKAFLDILHDERHSILTRNMMKHFDSQTASLADIKALSELEDSMTGKCQRPNGAKPLIKFTRLERYYFLQSITSNGIGACLLSKMIISPQEFSEIVDQAPTTRSITLLLDKLEKCSVKHLEDFRLALSQEGFSGIADAIKESRQLKPEPEDEENAPNSKFALQNVSIKQLQIEQKEISKEFEKMKKEVNPQFSKGQKSKYTTNIDDENVANTIMREGLAKLNSEYRKRLIELSKADQQLKPKQMSDSSSETDSDDFWFSLFGEDLLSARKKQDHENCKFETDSDEEYHSLEDNPMFDNTLQEFKEFCTVSDSVYHGKKSVTSDCKSVRKNKSSKTRYKKKRLKKRSKIDEKPTDN